MEKLTCKKANQMDLVDYLASIGFQAAKIRNQDYWYLSPLHHEKTASFKVNRERNIWYDHALGKGGTLVDFGILYHGCGVAGFLGLLSTWKGTFPFHRPIHSIATQTATHKPAGERKNPSPQGINVVDVRPLENAALLSYLQSRGISIELAKRHCREVDFSLHGKKRTAIGFSNGEGGYELRSHGFKGSSSPKGVTHLGSGSEDLAVFEGFTDFLSFHELNKTLSAPLSDCLVLNSLAFLEKSRPLMERYRQVHLSLDRDAAGREHTRKALQWDGRKYIDRSELYRHHKDLNECLQQLRRRQGANLRKEPSHRGGFKP